MLLVPRKPFLFAVGGKPMISVPHGLDDANGPKPISCDITQITDDCFHIDYVIEVCLTDCTNATGQVAGAVAGVAGALASPSWLSLRFVMSHDIDEYGYSTLGWQGKIICKSDILFKGGPDSLRGAVTPLPLPGFLRKSHYAVSADGLALEFNISDTEMYMTPPPGAVKASGTKTVSTPNGAKFMIDVNLRLEGRKDMNKKDLMEMAVAIAYDNVQRSSPIDLRGQTVLLKASFEEEMYGPGVSVHIQTIANNPLKTVKAQKTGGTLGRILGGFGFGAEVGKVAFEKLIRKTEGRRSPGEIIDTFNFGGDPLGSHKDAPMFMTYGNHGYLPLINLVASTFNDPCLQRSLSLPSQQVTDSTLRSTSIPGGTQLKNLLTPIGIFGRPQQSSVAPILGGISDGIQRGEVLASQDVSTISIVRDIDLFDDVAGDLFVAAETVNGVWDEYFCQFAYFKDTGKRAFPAMQSGGGTAFVQLHDTTTTVKVQWMGKKIGEPPAIPNAESLDTNLVFLDSFKNYPNVEIVGDGTLAYTQSGEYTYGVLDPDALEEQWPIPPWLNQDQGGLDSQRYAMAINDDVAVEAAGQIVGVGA